MVPYRVVVRICGVVFVRVGLCSSLACFVLSQYWIVVLRGCKVVLCIIST